MKTDRSGRTFEEYRQLYWDEKHAHEAHMIELNMMRDHVVELEDALKVEADENMAYKQRIAALARMTHRNGVECVHGKFLHEVCPQCVKLCKD